MEDKIIFFADESLRLNKLLNLKFNFTLELVIGLLILMI